MLADEPQPAQRRAPAAPTPRARASGCRRRRGERSPRARRRSRPRSTAPPAPPTRSRQVGTTAARSRLPPVPSSAGETTRSASGFAFGEFDVLAEYRGVVGKDLTLAPVEEAEPLPQRQHDPRVAGFDGRGQGCDGSLRDSFQASPPGSREARVDRDGGPPGSPSRLAQRWTVVRSTPAASAAALTVEPPSRAASTCICGGLGSPGSSPSVAFCSTHRPCLVARHARHDARSRSDTPIRRRVRGRAAEEARPRAPGARAAPG